MKYYGICNNPDDLNDLEWAVNYKLLEKIRKMEKTNYGL